MRLARALELGDVTAVQLEMACAGRGLAHVAGQRDRAVSLDRRALILLRDEAEDTCGLQTAVRRALA